jgi:hypothetical protein
VLARPRESDIPVSSPLAWPEPPVSTCAQCAPAHQQRLASLVQSRFRYVQKGTGNILLPAPGILLRPACESYHRNPRRRRIILQRLQRVQPPSSSAPAYLRHSSHVSPPRVNFGSLQPRRFLAGIRCLIDSLHNAYRQISGTKQPDANPGREVQKQGRSGVSHLSERPGPHDLPGRSLPSAHATLSIAFFRESGSAFEQSRH